MAPVEEDYERRIPIEIHKNLIDGWGGIFNSDMDFDPYYTPK